MEQKNEGNDTSGPVATQDHDEQPTGSTSPQADGSGEVARESKDEQPDTDGD